jgi:hypothetical protein
VLAAPVAGVIMLTETDKRTTLVTACTEHVALSDAQQTELANERYAKALRQDRANIVSSGPAYDEVRRVATRVEAGAARDKPAFHWRVTLLAGTRLAGGDAVDRPALGAFVMTHRSRCFVKAAARNGWPPRRTWWPTRPRTSRGQKRRIPVPALTAEQVVSEALAVEPGDTVLVNGRERGVAAPRPTHLRVVFVRPDGDMLGRLAASLAEGSLHVDVRASYPLARAGGRTRPGHQRRGRRRRRARTVTGPRPRPRRVT